MGNMTFERKLPGKCIQGKFTLLELLVSIAVIGLLAALLVPVLSLARQNACRCSCANNLKQIALCAGIYSDENDGWFLPADLNDTGEYRSWINYLYDINKEEKVFVCPSLSEDECFEPFGGNAVVDIKHASYCMNTIAYNEWDGAENFEWNPAASCGWGENSTHPVKQSQVRHYDEKIYIMDFTRCTPDHTPVQWGSDARSLRSYKETDHGEPGFGADKRDTGFNHKECFNAVMGDGHVRTFRKTKPENWVVIEGN
jgi:prepilin-type N-terminal cleavage/methylation domain-containing protein